MLIEGFGIAGYRSFGPDLQKISPCRKINLLVGQNNSGKSNVLLFLKQHLAGAMGAVFKSAKFSLPPLERHISPSDIQFSFALSMPFSGNKFRVIRENLPDERARKITNSILRSEVFTQGDNAAWFVFRTEPSDSRLGLTSEFIKKVKNEIPISPHDWFTLWQQLTRQSAGDFSVHWVPETLGWFRNELLNPPNVKLIPAIRKIDKGATNEDDYSGLGLIDQLALLQNPPAHEGHLRKRFDNINQFLQHVVGNSSATLEIPYSRDTILVEMDGRRLPLINLGTGLHEVTILAAAATGLTNHIVCIEEPELHLHPLLQKKLVRYLNEKTDNQYFFTTHSAHLLDTPNAAIFHVRHQNGTTTIERVGTPADKSRIAVDLGYRASDLVQANCVIWVEGPSDRIYLKHWIAAIDPELIEGIHYSIMFYGGRLLTHLSADDQEITDFISLRRLNRFITILIDSDKSKSLQRLTDTKRRVRDEFDQGPGFAWVTQGREIENYIRPQTIQSAVMTVHTNVKKMMSTDRFGKALEFKRSDKRGTFIADKVKIARAVVRESADLSILDLKQQIEKVIAFIREANDG